MIKTLQLLFILSLSINGLGALSANEYPVGITPSMPFIEVNHQGTTVIVKRVQDTNNKLVDDFAKTSRACPPFCIHPMQAAAGVETIGEVELLNFINKDVARGSGLVVDARMPRFYQSETIPSSVNIPFILFSGANKEQLLSLLGVEHKNDRYDFSHSKDLVLFCNGPWCDQSPRAIKALIQTGYPASKLKYYRGGMQLWKIFSLTTVLPSGNLVDNH